MLRTMMLVLALGPAIAVTALADGKPTADAKKEAKLPKSFASKPPVGTKAICPVSGEEFTIKEKTKFVTHKGRVYGFCCPDCQGDFDKNPAKFADK